MTTLTSPYYTTYATDDALRTPLPTADHTLDRRPTAPVLDATRLWTGGLATAAVAALVGLVGSLVIRVLFEHVPVGATSAHVSPGRPPGCCACSPPSPPWAPPASPTC